MFVERLAIYTGAHIWMCVSIHVQQPSYLQQHLQMLQVFLPSSNVGNNHIWPGSNSGGRKWTLDTAHDFNFDQVCAGVVPHVASTGHRRSDSAPDVNFSPPLGGGKHKFMVRNNPDNKCIATDL